MRKFSLKTMAKSRLLLKVFGWFWLALSSMLLVLAITIAAIDPEIIGVRWTPLIRNVWLETQGAELARAYESGGALALRNVIAKRTGAGGALVGTASRLFVFNRAGRELTGSQFPPAVAHIAGLVGQDHAFQIKLSMRRTLVGWSAVGAGG